MIPLDCSLKMGYFFKRVVKFRQTSLEREQLLQKSVFLFFDQSYFFRDLTLKILFGEKVCSFK